MNEKAEFAVGVIKQYALENQIPARSTSDLSPMEQWLILRLFTVSNGALKDNNKLVDNMCMSYRHDFGLMENEQQDRLRFECKEWLRAYENNRERCC